MNKELKPCPSCDGDVRLYAHSGEDYWGCLARCQKCKTEYMLKTKLGLLKNSIKVSKTVITKAKNEWNRSVEEYVQQKNES